MIDVCVAIEEMWKDGVKQGVDILFEIVQKLRSGKSVDELRKEYDKDIIDKALLSQQPPVQLVVCYEP